MKNLRFMLEFEPPYVGCYNEDTLLQTGSWPQDIIIWTNSRGWTKRRIMNMHRLKDRFVFSLICAPALIFYAAPMKAAAAPKPLKVLLITGGCCHDYATQKDILKKGITERANV